MLRMRTLYAILILILIISGVFLWYTFSRKNPEPVLTTETIPSTERSTVLVYFIDNNNEATTTSCGITRGVARNVKKGEGVYKNTLINLFEGPNRYEKDDGLISTFEPPSSLPANIKSLADYFNGISIVDGVAIVDFKEKALLYLNSTACTQESIKRPIENTLKQFPEIEQVEYSINGEVFRDWDA